MDVNFKNEAILYREEQQYRQSWLWVLIIFTSITALLPGTLIAFTGKKSHADGFIVMGCVLLIESVNVALFYITKFETIVTGKGIYYRWWPFLKKYTFLNGGEIERVYVEKWTLSSWGFSKRTKFGRAHTVNGDKGVQVLMMDGRQYYIGSQNVLLLQAACEQVVKNKGRCA